MYRSKKILLQTNPCVVEAVTDTTIIVAAGTISLKSTFVTSRSFLNNYRLYKGKQVCIHNMYMYNHRWYNQCVPSIVIESVDSIYQLDTG